MSEIEDLREQLRLAQEQITQRVDVERLRDDLALAQEQAAKNLLVDTVVIAPWVLITPENSAEYEASEDGVNWFGIRARSERDPNAGDTGANRMLFGLKNGPGGTWRRVSIGELAALKVRTVRPFVGFKGEVIGTRKPLPWDPDENAPTYVLVKVTREQERLTRLALKRNVKVEAVVSEVKR